LKSVLEGNVKKLLLGSATVMALTGVHAAMAADMPLKAPPIVPLFTWNGFYIGGTAGGAWGQSDYSEVPTGSWLSLASNPTTFQAQGAGAIIGPLAAVGTGSISRSGFIGGGEIGFNSQVGAVVWGLEADISGWGMSKNAVVTGPGIVSVPGSSLTATTSLDSTWLATVRPRLGWASGYWLFYVTGGIAISNVDFTQSILFGKGSGGSSGSSCSPSCGPLPFGTGSAQAGSVSSTMGGWTVGGGIEYALGYHWSIKGEYLYVSFINQNANQVNPVFPTFTGTAYGNLTASIARAGVNYRF
jgi:outer membrane immunogenic protein